MVGPALLFWAVAMAALAADPAQTNPDQETIIGQLIRQQMHMTSIILEDIKIMTTDIQGISEKITNLENKFAEGPTRVDIKEMSEKIDNLENKMAEGSNEVTEIKVTLAEQTAMVKYLYDLGMNKTIMLEEMAAGIERLVNNDISDCSEVAVFVKYSSGVYTIGGGVKMYCDIEGGEGWTVIQRKYSGSQSFDKNWTDYKNGFGDLDGEFWLGNEKIHALTSRKPHMIQFVLGDCGDHGDRLVANYRTFSVGNESSGYRLTIEGYSGNATDGMNECTTARYNHNGMRFTTRDNDNDQRSDDNCARFTPAAGWWYNSCYCSRLNGHNSQNVPWWNYDKKIRCKSSKMRIKPLPN